LHHFIAAGVWDARPVETELLVQADKLVGGSDAVLVIDDTAIPKKGTHSVGVAAQYASALGKTANCQTLVSLTLARGEVPVMLALRLFLPEIWTSKRARLERAGVPAEYRTARTKPEMALAEIDCAIAAGVHFGCVLADAGYGLSAPFRQGLTARKLGACSPRDRKASSASRLYGKEQSWTYSPPRYRSPNHSDAGSRGGAARLHDLLKASASDSVCPAQKKRSRGWGGRFMR
jgi:SRSO17 transposase